MTRHISEDLLFRMAAEPVTDAGQRQVRLAQLARTLHKLYETTEQDIELFRTCSIPASGWMLGSTIRNVST